MNGFESRRQQKLESIRQAAAHLFLKNPVDKVTVEEIAAEAKVSYATVFKYFGSKQDLVVEVMKWLYERSYEELEEILKGDKPYLQRIQEMMFQKGRMFENANLDLFEHARSYNPQEISRIAALYEEKKKHLYYEFFQEGKDNGLIHPDIPIDAIILCRKALMALIRTEPEIIIEFKHDAELLKGFFRILLYGVTGSSELPGINISL